MFFDHTKETLKVRDTQLQISLHRSQLIFVDNLRIDMTVLKSSRDVYDTYNFFGNVISEINITRTKIKETEIRIGEINEQTRILLNSNEHFSELINKCKDDEFE